VNDLPDRSKGRISSAEDPRIHSIRSGSTNSIRRESTKHTKHTKKEKGTHSRAVGDSSPAAKRAVASQPIQPPESPRQPWRVRRCPTIPKRIDPRVLRSIRPKRASGTTKLSSGRRPSELIVRGTEKAAAVCSDWFGLLNLNIPVSMTLGGIQSRATVPSYEYDKHCGSNNAGHCADKQ
jgi:hypothetical protein